MEIRRRPLEISAHKNNQHGSIRRARTKNLGLPRICRQADTNGKRNRIP